MAIFEKFPYLNFHSLNLDWLLKKTKEHTGEIAALDARIKALEDAPDIRFEIDGDGLGDVTCSKTFEEIRTGYSSNTAVSAYNGIYSNGYIIDTDIHGKETLQFYFQYPMDIAGGDAVIRILEIDMPDPRTHIPADLSYTWNTYSVTLDS